MVAFKAFLCHKQTACLTYLIYLIHYLHHSYAFEENSVVEEDILNPYTYYPGGHLDINRNRRRVRETCRPIAHGNTTFETLSKRVSKQSGTEPFKLKMFSKRFGARSVHGHVVTVPNPLKSFSVLEPLQTGGCEHKKKATVKESSKQMHCNIAVNAGYFNTHTGECLGNIVSNGRFVHDAEGIQNANFGIFKNGTLVTGYLSEQDVTPEANKMTDFYQLVTGVVWIVRNGKPYINESLQAECRDIEDTGSLHKFANVVSARTALGHDANGNVIIVQVDGRTGQLGVNLHEFASILQSYGLVNAINLDGGGSATFVVNQNVVNYPSDKCDHYLCERPVTTILCIRDTSCVPEGCNGHGHCGPNGQCVCDKPWTGPSCLKKTNHTPQGGAIEPSSAVLEKDHPSCAGNSSNCSVRNSTTKELIKRFLVKNYAWMDALLGVSLIVNVILLAILFCGSSNRSSIRRSAAKYPDDRKRLLIANNYDD